MAEAILTISSKNYSSWSLRGWLLVRFSGLAFTEESALSAFARRDGRRRTCMFPRKCRPHMVVLNK
jgi:hypothetical protein